MINQFLKAKHWQIFALTFGIPILLQMIFMGFILSKVVGRELGDNPEDILESFSYMIIFPIIMILFAGIYYGWFYSVGVGLQKYIPTELRMNVNRFKVFFFLPVLYMLGFLLFFIYIFQSIAGTPAPPNFSFFFLFFFLHIFAMASIFYSMYFVAKTIKLAQLQKGVTGSEFVGEFFLIWFFPVGVWFLQPVINKIVGELEEEILV